MLFRQSILASVQAGEITLAFRRWKRPTVRAGGSLLTALGVLAIDSVEPVEIEAITEDDAVAAGFSGLEALHAELSARPQGAVYRIELGAISADPRIALRTQVPGTLEEREILKKRLDRWDAASRTGPWSRETLRLIAARLRLVGVADRDRGPRRLSQ